MSRYDYSSTQVNLPDDLASAVMAWGRDNIPETDVYRDPDDPTFGRETEPHVTVLYGLYETNAKRIRYTVSHEKPFEVELGVISIFENPEFDVVKIEVNCPALHDLNATLRQKFRYRQVFHTYSPHVTIAYVKKGRGKKFEGDPFFQGKTFTARQVVYSGKHGKSVLPLLG